MGTDDSTRVPLVAVELEEREGRAVEANVQPIDAREVLVEAAQVEVADVHVEELLFADLVVAVAQPSPASSGVCSGVMSLLQMR